MRVESSVGLGIVGGTRDDLVEFGEDVIFIFNSGSATDISLIDGETVGSGTANATIEAFAPAGGSLGTQTVDFFLPGTVDVSSLFGDVPIESFIVTPLNTNLDDRHTAVAIEGIGFIPEPTTALLLAAGLAGLAAAGRRRSRHQ